MKEDAQLSGENQLLSPQVTIEQLLGGVVPAQFVEKQDSYAALARRPLTILAVGTDRIVVGFGEINGEELAHLLHFAAPSKELGINFERILKEWRELFSGVNQHRLQAHRGVTGWDIYEPYRAILLDAIVGSYEEPRTDTPCLLPVINLKRGESGQFVWDFEPLAEDVSETLAQNLHTQATVVPILGPLLAAAYSPEITQAWAGIYGKRNYRRPVDTIGKGSRDMGSTEVLPLALGEAESLLTAPLVQAIVHLANNA